MFSLLFVSCLITTISAICNCANFVNEDAKGKTYRRLAGCNDIELKTECQRAEWEMVDFVNGVMNFAQTLTIAHPSEDKIERGGLLGIEIDANNLGELSEALEKYRPVPDCSTALFTTTPVKILQDRSNLLPIWKEDYDDDDAPSEDFCISIEILKECESAQEKIKIYIEQVIMHLKADDEISDQFKRLMERRLTNSILPTISCKTTKHVIKKINNASQKEILNIFVYLIIFIYIF